MSPRREHHVDPGPGKEEAWGFVLPSPRGTRRPNCPSVSSQFLDIEDTNQGPPCPCTPKDEAKPTRRAHHGSLPLASHGGPPASAFMGEAGVCWESSLFLLQRMGTARGQPHAGGFSAKSSLTSKPLPSSLSRCSERRRSSPKSHSTSPGLEFPRTPQALLAAVCCSPPQISMAAVDFMI